MTEVPVVEHDEEILKQVETDKNDQQQDTTEQDLENERNRLKVKSNITLTNREVKEKPFL